MLDWGLLIRSAAAHINKLLSRASQEKILTKLNPFLHTFYIEYLIGQNTYTIMS